MVKEFGNQFEQFTLEFFKRVVNCPIVIRDYEFRKKSVTNKGKLRESPTDLDVFAYSKNKIYLVTCQEWISSQKKREEEEIERLVDNLNQAINDIKEKINTQNQKIIPIIAFVAMKEESLKMLENKVREIIKERVALLSFLDMFFKFIEVWEKTQKSWMPAGNFDWFFSRIIGWFKIDSKKLKELINESNKLRKREHKKYNIYWSDDIQNYKLEFLYPFSNFY